MILCKYRQRNSTTGNDCYLPYEKERCIDNYEGCLVYQRKIILERGKSDYNNEPLGIGGADLETYERIQRECSIPFITMPKKKESKIEEISCEEQLKRLREIK